MRKSNIKTSLRCEDLGYHRIKQWHCSSKPRQRRATEHTFSTKGTKSKWCYDLGSWTVFRLQGRSTTRCDDSRYLSSNSQPGARGDGAPTRTYDMAVPAVSRTIRSRHFHLGFKKTEEPAKNDSPLKWKTMCPLSQGS